MGGRGASMGRGEMRERKGEEELVGQGDSFMMCVALKVVALLSHMANIKPHVERGNLVRHSGAPPLRLGRQRGVPENPFSV